MFFKVLICKVFFTYRRNYKNSGIYFKIMRGEQVDVMKLGWGWPGMDGV